MNKKQAELVTDLMQEGFVEEALVLAQAYTQEVDDFENERLATVKDSMSSIKRLLISFLPFTKLKTILADISSRLFPEEEINIKTVLAKVAKVALAIIAVLTPFILLLLYTASLESQRDQGQEKKDHGLYPWTKIEKQKKYHSLVTDSLGDLKDIVAGRSIAPTVKRY